MNRPELVWLAGDHHVHTAYSHDRTYTVVQQAKAAARHGLAWMVVTDHGGADHAKIAVKATNTDVVEVRASLPAPGLSGPRVGCGTTRSRRHRPASWDRRP